MTEKLDIIVNDSVICIGRMEAETLSTFVPRYTDEVNVSGPKTELWVTPSESFISD